MANIVGGRVVEDRKQADGRRRVRYELTDKLGKRYYVNKLVPPTFDTATDLAAEQTRWETMLPQQELEGVVERIKDGLIMERVKAGLNPTDITTDYATADQVRQAVFQWWQTADPLDARWLVPAIDALTDADLQTMLGIDQATTDAIRARAARLRQINDLVALG